MTMRLWSIVRARSTNYPSVDQILNHLQKSQTSPAATSDHCFLPLRSISSSVIKRRADGAADGTESGGLSEPAEDSSDGSQDRGDKRMWRKWIEERLSKQKPSSNEKRSPLLASRSSVEADGKASFEKGNTGEDGGLGKRSPSLDSFFKNALKSSSDSAGKSEEVKTTNTRNPFRGESNKSSFFPNRESSKNTSFLSKRGSFFQESARRPLIFQGRQSPSKSPQLPADDLPFEDLDEFEKRVLGSVNDTDETRDDDFLRELDEIGRSARGIRDDDSHDLPADEDEDWRDEKVKGLTDLALANAEMFDLEDEENPYRLRPDRLFFPGQTYDPVDLDLSKEPDPEKPTSRTRKRYRSKEVFQVADFRNPRYLSNFIRESSRILPRRHFQLSAKAQRKIAREIKTARILGLMPFTSMGDPPFRFLRSWSEEDNNSRFDDY